MTGLRVPSFTEWLASGLKPSDALQAPEVTVTERVGRGIERGLVRLGVDERRAVGMARGANQALGFTPVGAMTETIDAGIEARKQSTAAGQAAALGGGAVMAALGAVPGGKAAGKLAMDEASRMARAREMGFTKEAYHGSDNAGDFAHLEPSKNGELGPGVYVGDTDRANWYAKIHPRRPDNHGAVYPLLIQEGKYLDEADFDAAVKVITSAPVNSPEEMAARIAVTEDLKRQGYLGVRGDQSARNLPGDTSDYSVFDPANIRSRFAAFDPAKRNSKNLMAGVAGAAVGVPTFADFLANQQDPDL